MSLIYNDILQSITSNNKNLAVLIDPDKTTVKDIPALFEIIDNSLVTHVFVGGSTVDEYVTEKLIQTIQEHTKLPVIIFPGDVTQISNKADALLFLSLISGDNPEYLIGKQVKASQRLRNSNLEIIPTGYILIENGKTTAVELKSQTKPIPRNKLQQILDTAKAGEYLGMKLIYLEAGSGALHPIPEHIIGAVKKDLTIPLIVGGGIKSKEQMEDAFNAGADMVVIGTAFENDTSFFDKLKE